MSPPPSYDPIAAIRQARIVPVLRTTDDQEAAREVDRLLAAGHRVLELTTTIPDWRGIVGLARSRNPEICLGLGTITTSADVRDAVSVGVQFCVSPTRNDTIRQTCEDVKIPYIAGGFSPTEVLEVAKYGVAKLFPAHAVGPDYLRSLLAVAPGAQIMPTGGIEAIEAQQWLEAGALAVGIGSSRLHGTCS